MTALKPDSPSLEELRYPIGDFIPPATDSPEIRSANVEILRSLSVQLTLAVAGLTDTQLDTPYREGGWTVRQTVHHVADSHANAYVRFKLALTENWPTIKPYDQAQWATLPDSQLPVAVSLDLLTALHLRWVTLLESMSNADFEKGYVHPARNINGGRQPLWEVLAMYGWHSLHHTAHIVNLRRRMGW
jgi:uncharacterized damage-inducible protein DinB